jgi:Fe-S oxidoreductase
MKTLRTADGIVEDMITLIRECIDELKDDYSEMAFGERLAYIECLEIIKGEVAGDEDKFGLDGDLEEKFELIKYVKKKQQ